MSDKLALVTGASSGIGLSLAKELAKRDYDLVICSAGQRLDEATADLVNLGAQVTQVKADLSTREGVDELWATTRSLQRSLDVACINAGIGLGGLFAETDLNTELEMVGLNCASTVHLAKHVVRLMTQQNFGRILFTASIAGEMVAPREAVYAATKAFVLSFAHSLRYELKDTGVTVTALQPGPTDTDFFHRGNMDHTKVGSEGLHESSPGDVAREGLDALFAEKDHVYAGSLKTKIEGMVANLVPGELKGAMHDKMARPFDAEHIK